MGAGSRVEFLGACVGGRHLLGIWQSSVCPRLVCQVLAVCVSVANGRGLASNQGITYRHGVFMPTLTPFSFHCPFL